MRNIQIRPPNPLNRGGVFRLPRRLLLTAETPAPVPIAQLAPRPRPRVLGGGLAVPDEGRKHRSSPV
jgi:hypothetical protein